jgi:hypothetical protein
VFWTNGETRKASSFAHRRRNCRFERLLLRVRDERTKPCPYVPIKKGAVEGFVTYPTEFVKVRSQFDGKV